jgi:hypothetical protein
MQSEALSHAMASALLYKWTVRRVKTTVNVQYTVINVNMEVMMARSHFRAQLCSPLVLFHHKKKTLEKKRA